MTFSCIEECNSHDLPAKEKRFDGLFKQIYRISLASSNEYIFKAFFFVRMEHHQYGIFVRSTAQSNKSGAAEGAVHELASIEKIAVYLVRYSYLFIPI